MQFSAVGNEVEKSTKKQKQVEASMLLQRGCSLLLNIAALSLPLYINTADEMLYIKSSVISNN